MLELLPWLLALLSAVVLVTATALWWSRRSRPEKTDLPAEWALTARPVFNGDERRVYRQLREALPHHIVLSKLPLVRFCQPVNPDDTRYWYRLLGSIHVTFAVCSANGRVLAAIDLDGDRHTSRRTVQIKQAVLAACRVRYLRCPVDHLPSIPELQLLVPQGTAAGRAPQAAPSVRQMSDSLASTVATRRRERHALWQDSSVFHDSFFGADTRGGESTMSDFGALRSDFGALRSAYSLRELSTPDDGPPASPYSPPAPPPVRH